MRVYPVILAGGKGTRIGAKSRPKVLFELAHKPILDWTIRSVKKAVKQTPIIVIGYKGEQIKKYFGSQFLYVWQKKLLGTAHAFLQAKKVLKNKKGWCLVVNGDNPLFLPQTFKKMIKKGLKTQAELIILSGILDERFSYGRVIKNQTGEVIDIIEEKDADDNTKKIKLKNCGAYLVKIPWGFKAVAKLKKSPVTGEYYITDLVKQARLENKKVFDVQISDWTEAVGINTLEQLQLAEEILKKRLKNAL